MEMQDMENNLMDFVNSYSFKDKKEAEVKYRGKII